MIRADIGAYVRTAALVPAEFGAALLPGPYRVPSYTCDLWSVVTNKTPVGTLRSPGRPECNFVRERLMDQGAARLGIDAAEIRRRNLLRPDELPYWTAAMMCLDSGRYGELLDLVADTVGAVVGALAVTWYSARRWPRPSSPSEASDPASPRTSSSPISPR